MLDNMWSLWTLFCIMTSVSAAGSVLVVIFTDNSTTRIEHAANLFVGVPKAIVQLYFLYLLLSYIGGL